MIFPWLQQKREAVALLRGYPPEEHMANYQAARALMGKGNSERVRERGSRAKKGAKKSAVKKAKPKK